MKALTTRNCGTMTFLHASQIAREQGCCACLLLPGDHLLSTEIESTVALFASREGVGPVLCFSYNDLAAMDEQAVTTSLKNTVTSSADELKKRLSQKA